MVIPLISLNFCDFDLSVEESSKNTDCIFKKKREQSSRKDKVSELFAKKEKTMLE